MPHREAGACAVCVPLPLVEMFWLAPAASLSLWPAGLPTGSSSGGALLAAESSSLWSPPSCQQYSRAALPSEVSSALARGPIKSRVLVIGMSHTGTTSLREMLGELGCCYSTHNLDQTRGDIGWTWGWQGYAVWSDCRKFGLHAPFSRRPATGRA